MTLLVPFDNSDLSRAALDRAKQYAELTGEEIVALSVIPDDPAFARDRGWLAPEDTFDVGIITRKLRQEVDDLAPAATHRSELIENNDHDDAVATTTIDIVRVIRQVAADVEASVLFLGSENAGRVSAPLASVGNPLAEDPQYDVFIVRHAR